MRPAAQRPEILLLWVLLSLGGSSRLVAAPASEWRGEWGAWSRPAGNSSLRGGSLFIFDCKEVESTCRVRVQAESGESSYVGPETGIELEISSPSTATAQWVNDDATPKDCYLELTMAADGNGRSLHAHLAGRLHRNAPREQLAAARESLLARCEHASDVPACLRAWYATAPAGFERDLRAAQEAHDREEQALSTPGDSSQAARVLAAIQGVYKLRFTNLMVDGTKFPAENILEIVPVGNDSLYFRTHLEFYNGHLCKAYGIARFTSAGRFVFEDRNPQPPAGDPHCRLQLAVTDQEIQFIDPDGVCGSCGMRGHLDGAAFARTARRPIRYLARLKSSREYREAVTASSQP